MDEPTNHLSVKETEKVLRWIEKLKAEGTTVFLLLQPSSYFIQ